MSYQKLTTEQQIWMDECQNQWRSLLTQLGVTKHGSLSPEVALQVGERVASDLVEGAYQAIIHGGRGALHLGSLILLVGRMCGIQYGLSVAKGDSEFDNDFPESSSHMWEASFRLGLEEVLTANKVELEGRKGS